MAHVVLSKAVKYSCILEAESGGNVLDWPCTSELGQTDTANDYVYLDSNL